MRTLFLSNLYPPTVVGGYEKLCADVAAAFVARGIEVSVLTASYGRCVSSHPGQLVHQALQLLVGSTVYQPYLGNERQREATSRANVTALRRTIDEVRPDVIFCWNLFGLGTDFFDAVLASGVPVVVMLTDNWLIGMKQPDFLAHYFKTRVWLGAAEAVPRIGDAALPCAAIFGSRFMRDLHQEAGLRFTPSTIVHNGVRQEARSPDAFRDRTGLTEEGKFCLLFAGRIVEIKGLHTLIEALPLVRASARGRLDLSLTVVGGGEDGDYLQRIRRMAEERGIAGMISFQNPVPESELFDLFQQFDAYVFPSLYEPFSLTLILALAAGMPTLASDVGGNVEIVEHEQTGLLFPSSDPQALAAAIARLLDDSALRQRLSERSREAARSFTFDRMVSEMIAFIEAVRAQGAPLPAVRLA